MARRPLASLLMLLVLCGCAARVTAPVTPPPPVVKPLPLPAPKAPALVRLSEDQYPRFDDDMDLASLEAAIEKSLRYYSRAAGSGPRLMAERMVTVRELKESLIALREILRSGASAEARQERIRETFEVYQSTGLDGGNTVLFTGYFEPIMEGSLEKTPRFRHPVYMAPGDAIVANLGKFNDRYLGEQLVGRISNGELIPYYSRSEIEDHGALQGRNLEIAWVDDRINLFFLHTQGSGKLRLPDGRLLQIGYAMKNGRPFRSLGRFLMDTGKISPQEMSYQAIKRYLREHPEELSEILGHNESFIFFREVKEGPVGSLGEILTAGRSIATDAAVFPKGAPAFIRMRKPVLDREGNALSWTPFSRFVFSQDAGGMIKGPGRVDLYCGSGDEAEMVAGSLKERGDLYFLVKKKADGSSSTDQQ